MAETISFARSLYHPQAIRAAAEAFAELASITVEAGDDETAVQIAEPDPDVADVIVDEFCNYALSETIVLLRATGDGSGEQAPS